MTQSEYDAWIYDLLYGGHCEDKWGNVTPPIYVEIDELPKVPEFVDFKTIVEKERERIAEEAKIPPTFFRRML